MDNGREFLTYDIGGLGHRQKKPKNGQEPFSPPPVFERLGIKMTNAIVRNAKAKIIERRSRTSKTSFPGCLKPTRAEMSWKSLRN